MADLEAGSNGGLSGPVPGCEALGDICSAIVNLTLRENVDSFDTMIRILQDEVLERLDVLTRGEENPERIPQRKKNLLSLWIEETHDFVDRFREISLLFGVKAQSSSDEEVFVLWRLLHFAGSLIPNIKYSVNVAFCRHFDLEMPESIKFDLGLKLFPKSFRVALGRLRSAHRRMKKSSLFLINSLFQGWKKGLLPLDIQAYDRNLLKHCSVLCETSGTIREEVGDDIFRITRDLVGGFQPSTHESGFLVPSTKATIESKSYEHGAFGFLFREFTSKDFYEIYIGDDFKGRKQHVLSDFLEPDILLGFCEERGKRLVEVHGRGCPTLSELKELERSMWLPSLFDDFNVSPYGILEPLKIRTITRPSLRTHFGLRHVQKDLLSYLNRFPMFQITGDSNKDHLPDHCSSLLSNDLLDSIGFSSFVSGDYSAATDTLRSDVTKIIWEVVGARYPWWVYKKGLKSLCETCIDYDNSFPKMSHDDPYCKFIPKAAGFGIQTNGQLMGNILSFPILCIANYCSWHIAMERYFSRKFSVEELTSYGVCVNGDDILFRANDSFYSTWKLAISEFGFKLSLGKNFFSSSIFQINSQLFKVKGLLFPTRCERVPYFNFGLLTGRKKGMTSEQFRTRFDSQFDSITEKRTKYEVMKDFLSVPENFALMQKECPETKKGILSQLQLSWLRRRFKALVTVDQWKAINLPTQIGGLGLGESGWRKGKDCLKFNSDSQVKACFSILKHDALASELFPHDYSLGKMVLPEYPFRVNHPKRKLMDMVLPQQPIDMVTGYLPIRSFCTAL